eukprot:CAMPEP_0198137770 /NCGR_PEP_ID=MMETSP1443-20131203/1224_1 /TAXON_ID=186043 /ORGANISM="Entomoneis sp., Strain CCMP2396" /LENGTH=536 /DNA_ID=CAMNT_0043799309 /DNA_START=276 /DNA_END=1886 /DNA_ORIENTATION=+
MSYHDEPEEAMQNNGVVIGITAGGYGAEPYGEVEQGETDALQGYRVDEEVVDAIHVEVIMTTEEEEMIKKENQMRVITAVVCGMVVLAAIVIPVAVVVSNNNSDSESMIITPAATDPPTMSPTLSPTVEGLREVISGLAPVTSFETFQDRSSGQFRAVDWINEDPFVAENGLSPSDKRFVDRYALASIYFAMGGDQWTICGQSNPECDVAATSFGWLSNNDVCDWHMMICDGTDVRGINLGSQLPLNRRQTQLLGEFPSELTALTDLVQLHLKESRVTNIPTFLSALTNLEELNFEDNEVLTGPFFNFSAVDFPKLRVLVLTNNRLTGEIPSKHGTFSTIREYRAGTNQLVGQIPDSLADMSLLAYLDLSNNLLLTGQVPERIFDLTELRVLSLHSNRDLSGVFPAAIEKLTFLEYLRMNATAFGGPIPNELYTLPNLQEISLRSCKFSGPIDQSVQNLTFLLKFDVGFNLDINGAIPDVFGEIEFLQVLKLDNTGLTGAISEALCNATGKSYGEIKELVVDCSIDIPDGCNATCV